MRCWHVAALVLAILGIVARGVNDRLEPDLYFDVPGTPSSKANAILREHFGRSAPFAVLLRGPAAAIDRQDPVWFAPCAPAIRGITTLSPWDRG